MPAGESKRIVVWEYEYTTRKILAAAAAATVSAACATGAFAQAATQDVQITASVPKFCTIGGAATPTALTTTIPVSSTGTVTTTPQSFTVNSVTCNTAINVVATSQGGGVKSSTPATSGFTNIIDYSASASFGTATSTLNTAANPAASGAEAGTTGSTSGAATGNLTISITPAQPSSPLVAGTDYADTLRVPLTPP
jgi:hypothetical protein